MGPPEKKFPDFEKEDLTCPTCGHYPIRGDIWTFDFFGRICFLSLVLGGPAILAGLLVFLYGPENPDRIRARQEEQRRLEDLEKIYQP